MQAKFADFRAELQGSKADFGRFGNRCCVCTSRGLHKPSGRRRRNFIPRRRRKNSVGKCFDNGFGDFFNASTGKILPFFAPPAPRLRRGAGAPCLVPQATRALAVSLRVLRSRLSASLYAIKG